MVGMGVIVTDLRSLMPRRVTVPETGLMRVGAAPQLRSLVRLAFHSMPVFSTLDPVVRSSFADRAMGCPSTELSVIAQCALSNSADKLPVAILIGLYVSDQCLRSRRIDHNQSVCIRRSSPDEFSGVHR